MTARAAIKVNGTVLSTPAIAEEAQHHPAKTPAAAFEAAARALVVRHLLLEEAARCAIQADPQDVAPGKRETREDANIRALIEAHVQPREPDEAACRAFYEVHRARFRAQGSQAGTHAKPLPFKDVHEKIATYLTDQFWRRDAAEYIERLVARAEIEGIAMDAQKAKTMEPAG